MDHDRDLPSAQLLAEMERVLTEHPTAELYVKWTCPDCGERVTSDTANTFHAGGYRHEGCGGFYDGDRFGFMAVFTKGGAGG